MSDQEMDAALAAMAEIDDCRQPSHIAARFRSLDERLKAVEKLGGFIIVEGGAEQPVPLPLCLGWEDDRADGVGMIATERRRQVHREGYGSEHDDDHNDGMLIQVAQEILACDDLSGVSIDPDDHWGLIAKHGRREGGELRLLVIAGALVAAEIDRRLRLQEEAAHA